MNDARCGSCRYFKTDGADRMMGMSDGHKGACHRFPPATIGGFPTVRDSEWCGEFDVPAEALVARMEGSER